MRPYSKIKQPQEEILILTRESNKFKQKFELLKIDPAFQRDIILFRKKWGVDLDNPRLIVAGKNDLISMRKKYGLSKEWEYILRVYIATNKFEEMGDPHGIEVRIAKDGKSANIKIYPETTLRDIKTAYSHIIKTFKGGKIIKTKPGTNFDIESFALELRQKGKTYKEIDDLIESNYSKQDRMGFDLSKNISKLKKRRKLI